MLRYAALVTASIDDLPALAAQARAAWSRVTASARRLRTVGAPLPWSGVYSSFREVAPSGGGFAGRAWLDAMRSETRRQADEGANTDRPPTHVAEEHALLPLLVAAELRPGERVRVVDFGGGAGATYHQLVRALPARPALEYHLVEVPEVCRVAREVLAGAPECGVHESLATVPRPVDVVHVCSALQYLEDPLAQLRALAGLGARHVFLVKLSAGSFRSYVTQQRMPGGDRVPYWFLDADEVVAAMRAAGYQLGFRSELARQYDQSNFPPALRMGRAVNLLFSRTA